MLIIGEFSRAICDKDHKLHSLLRAREVSFSLFKNLFVSSYLSRLVLEIMSIMGLFIQTARWTIFFAKNTLEGGLPYH